MSGKSRGPAARESTPASPVVVGRSGISGRGGFASRRIEAGEEFIEYTGERISQAEADRRYGKKPYTFLFEVSSRTVIDAAVGGNEARFINHSCRPNCEALIDRSRVTLTALRRIRQGEEITYDYILTRDPDLGAAEDALYPCHCGASNCRGTMLRPLPRRRRRPKR
jgi:uncharacterized protein